MIDVGLFIQVRLSSTRLPEKALLPLEGKTVIGHVMASLSAFDVSRRVLVTDTESASRLAIEAEKYRFDVFAGNPDDVLDRYCRAIERYGVAYVVRATGDNPLTSCRVAQQALDLAIHSTADYTGITGTPYGTGVEVVKSSALLDLEQITTNRYEREHVTPGVYRRPERYQLLLKEAEPQEHMPDLRVTLDTPTDYDYISGIYRELYDGNPIEVPELIAYGQQHHKNSA